MTPEDQKFFEESNAFVKSEGWAFFVEELGKMQSVKIGELLTATDGNTIGRNQGWAEALQWVANYPLMLDTAEASHES